MISFGTSGVLMNMSRDLRGIAKRVVLNRLHLDIPSVAAAGLVKLHQSLLNAFMETMETKKERECGTKASLRMKSMRCLFAPDIILTLILNWLTTSWV